MKFIAILHEQILFYLTLCLPVFNGLISLGQPVKCVNDLSIMNAAYEQGLHFLH